MSVKGESLEVAGVPHYLARAAAPATAGVLLLPHVGGIDEFVRGFACELAERGLTAVAWNPYPELPIGSTFTDRPPRPNDEAVMKSLSGLVDVMESKLGLSAVATIGFCMGGRWVLMFGAREPRLRAAVACYPSVPAQRSPGQDVEPLPVVAAIACPVLLIYPGLDRVTPRPVFEALQALLQGRAAATSILHYPEAEHGFMHTPGAANLAATRSAKPQIYGFFDAHLGGDERPAASLTVSARA